MRKSLLAARQLAAVITLIMIGAAILVAVVYVVVAQGPVNSGTPQPLRVSPYSQSYSLSAGDIKKGAISIVNTSKDSQEVIVYVRPYSVDGTTYMPNFSRLGPGTDAFKWVGLEPSVRTIAPESSVSIPYSLEVPRDVSPGSYYGVIFAETRGRGEYAPSRTGQVLSVNIGGQARVGGELRKSQVPPWQPRSPVASTATVANTGDAGLDVVITTAVYGIMGGTKHTETTHYNLLPRTERIIGSGWEKSANFGLYNVEQTVKYLDQKHITNGYVVVAPRWFPVAIVLVVIIGGGYVLFRRFASRR